MGDLLNQLSADSDYKMKSYGMDHPQRQGEVTGNTYVNKYELQKRDEMKTRDDPRSFHPYGTVLEPADIFNMYQNELVYTMRRPKKAGDRVPKTAKRQKVEYKATSSTYPHVLVALNGLHCDYPPDMPAGRFRALSDSVQRFWVRRFVNCIGLVGTNNMQMHRDMGLAYLPTRYAGIYKMFNNGDKLINEGDTTLWNVPKLFMDYSKLPRKINDHKDKISLVVEPLDEGDYLLPGGELVGNQYDLIKAEIAEVLAKNNFSNAEFENVMRQDLRHRVIGKALSAAAPGEEFYFFAGQGYCM